MIYNRLVSALFWICDIESTFFTGLNNGDTYFAGNDQGEDLSLTIYILNAGTINKIIILLIV